VLGATPPTKELKLTKPALRDGASQLKDHCVINAISRGREREPGVADTGAQVLRVVADPVERLGDAGQ
jgi:hypothetical protein